MNNILQADLDVAEVGDYLITAALVGLSDDGKLVC